MKSQELTDVESLLSQVKLRSPSTSLDAAIEGLAMQAEAEFEADSNGLRPHRVATFGWPTIVGTAVAAMLAGLLLGQVFSFELAQVPSVASLKLPVGVPSSSDTSALTKVEFSVPAFELLHGHSQQPEYADCRVCHQVDQEKKENALQRTFRKWFYGDGKFFEQHFAHGFKACADCHVLGGAEKKLPEKPAQANGPHEELAGMSNCADCHKVDANGFEGFDQTWDSKLDSGLTFDG